MKNDDLKIALRDTMPVMAGYIVLGIGFGVILKTSGYSIWLAAIMSVFIFAGSMQYVAISLFVSKASLVAVALATLAVNARHLFYGISMVDKYKNTGLRKSYLIFGLTDETYSLVCNSERGANYYFFVTLFDQIYWVTGSMIGAWLGSALQFNAKGIDFALTALFITVFVDQWLNSKKHFPAIAGVLCSVVCLILFGADRFLIPTMFAITAVLLLNMRKEQKEDDRS